jgi:hypothetical protein
MANTPNYSHRLNRDGSFDSICTTCFATVARAKIEAELTELDATHVCNTSFLAGRGQLQTSGAQTFLGQGGPAYVKP